MFKFNFDYDKLHLKEVLLLIPKYHQNILSLLTPVLGLYGINVKEFITALEEKSRFVNYDLVLPVRVAISKIKTFEIFMKTPTVTSLMASYDSFTGNSIEVNFLSIYKIALIKSIYSNSLSSIRTKLYYKMIRSFMRSLNRNVHFLSSYKKTKRSSFDFINGLYKDFFSYNRLFSFKKLVFSNELYENKQLLFSYGLFFSFPGINNKKLFQIKETAALYNMACYKVFNSLFSKFVLGMFIGVFSERLSNLFLFYKSCFFESKSQFLLSFVKVKHNLCSPLFFKSYLNDFMKLSSKHFFILLFRLVSFKNYSMFKFMNKNTISLLCLLKNIEKNKI